MHANIFNKQTKFLKIQLFIARAVSATFDKKEY